jgi:hypothetical protein
MSDKESDALFSIMREIRDEQVEQGKAIATLAANQASASLQAASMQSVINAWMASGCPMGQRHESDIKELKDMPKNMLNTAIGVSAVMTTIGGILVWIILAVVRATKGEGA